MTAKKTEQNDFADNSTGPEETLHKQTENALRESEEKYRLLFENVSDIIFSYDREFRILSISPALKRILGYEPEDFIGKSFQSFGVLPPEYLGKAFSNATRLFDGERVESSIFEFIVRDGTRRFMEISGTPVFRNGQVESVTAVARDITERKRTEDALRESEEKYRLLFNTSPDSVNINRLEDGLYVDINDGFTKLTGFTSEDVIGRTPLEINIWNDPADRQKLVQGLREKGYYENLEARFRVKDGSIGTGLMSARIISLNGIPYIISITRDITERRRMEEELLKADKLESIGIFAGGIAHDFNNILTSIIGNISLARMNLKPGTRVFDLLSSAETASMRARGLTGQLLTFARGGTPVKETASISRLIEESSLSVLQGSKSRCEFSIAEDLWPVEADPGQISQVISNIVINANQAMPEGGIIRITAENLMPEKIHEIPVKPGRYIRISIKDQGMGIAEKHLSKIFDPYFTTKNEGSGLGLAAAYSIIKKHSGHISVDSLMGAGTTFHVYLPASDKEIPVKEEATLLTGEGKILLMDDDRMLREMAEDMLEMLGYESEFAEDGAEAIEMYRKAMESEKPYDAVILDLTIAGGMGGKEAVKKLLELDPQLKAIVCSGYSDDPVMSNYREYGFKGMMPKPFDLNALSRMLNDVLKGPLAPDNGEIGK